MVRSTQGERVFFTFDGRDAAEDLEKIVRTLTWWFGAQQVDELLGPYSRILRFRVRGRVLNLFDDSNREFYCSTARTDDLPAVEALAGEWEAALNELFPDG